MRVDHARSFPSAIRSLLSWFFNINKLMNIRNKKKNNLIESIFYHYRECIVHWLIITLFKAKEKKNKNKTRKYFNAQLYSIFRWISWTLMNINLMQRFIDFWRNTSKRLGRWYGKNVWVTIHRIENREASIHSLCSRDARMVTSSMFEKSYPDPVIF